MKIIYFTLCALFSLFSYSSDPLSINVLDGKILVCSDLGGLDTNLDTPHETYTLNKPIMYYYRSFGYQGFIFNKNKVENQWIDLTTEQEEGSGDYIASKSFLGSREGRVTRVTTQEISFKIYKESRVIKYYIDRKNLNLFGGDTQNTNCVVAKDRKTYNKFMKDKLIRYQEYIDKYNFNRRKKQIEEMKNNQI